MYLKMPLIQGSQCISIDSTSEEKMSCGRRVEERSCPGHPAVCGQNKGLLRLLVGSLCRVSTLDMCGAGGSYTVLFQAGGKPLHLETMSPGSFLVRRLLL
ncbi:hypothetical protein ATANTOWER_025337 [Ataeniobius toweri]|uniref:Uncharacterized protein n=1 Tax=Ataeniobius toweri TaxID=208326 RepID=A0ABU7CKW7_9TELE|nr:hypothetical protein [Ataeniobius toweri]